ncbi:MAG TPA: N-acetylmuramoyl-L-alanine amidase [Actinoplanes sp.]|nr:N-acetylmuramoyl-L-alanine amidase [Actinoplanes sp.]
MEQRRIIGVVVASAVVVAGAAVAALNWPAGGRGGAWATPPPIRSQLRTIDLAPADPKAKSVDLPERGTATFGMLGITWTDPKAAPPGTVQVRTRAIATGAWSRWRSLDAGEGRGPDTGAEAKRAARGGTDPLWVGPSNGVAVRIVSPKGKVTKALPAGLRLDLIDSSETAHRGSGGQGGGEVLDPSVQPSDTTSPAPATSESQPAATPSTPVTTEPATTAPATTAPATTAPTSAPPAAPAVMGPLPAYVSRAAWQADESLVTDPPSYADSVKVLFVHHTAGTNDYSCADSPAIIRGILAYHVQSQHWSDIGYNFLVDKCGTLFEGRRGGVDKALIGAHTYGFNTGSAGIAVLGTYSSVRVPAVTQTVLAQVAAYKLGTYGFDPSTSAQLTEGVADGKFPLNTVVTFNRVSGHRDGVATECPGSALYAQLADVRSQASTIVYGLAAKPVSGGVLSGGTYYVRGTATLNWTVATPPELLARFELAVDGKTVGSVPGTARSAPARLTDGPHRVAVRAVHVSNKTAITPSTSLVSDATAPAFSKAPDLTFRGGTVSTSSAPVTLSWKVTDAVKLASVALLSPAAVPFATTATSWATSAKVGVSRTWKMSASDAAGNVRTASAARTPVLIAETSAVRSGTWTAKSSTSYLNGAALTSARLNAKLTWTFTGRAVALTASRTASSGQIDVYVDGVKVGTVDLRSTTTQYRQVVWSKAFTGSAKHTVMINVRATAGRPGVILDDLVYLK